VIRASLASFLLAAAVPSFAQLAWKDLGDGRVELSEGGNQVLVYNWGPQLKPGAPDNRRRCCYIFPVNTPAGVSILDDFPQDHYHHRGLFWSWPIVEVGGKKYDIWMNFTAKHRPDQPPRVTADAKQARLDVQDFWHIEGGRDIVKENVRLTVLPAKAGARELAVELTWEAIKDPVTLAGSAEAGKSYGGFSARFAPRENTVLRADNKVLTKDEDLIGHHWAELEAVYGGKKAVLRITSDDKNPGVPMQWCLRRYGFIGASFPGRTASVDHYTLEPGKPLTLKFRVRIADLP
jgi:hypothetical protein